ncbi:MAG: FKBP-type peptidyl-prolyl cis-trans isomerase [Coriobacteriales bacterium]|jgi:FKBP-type peptidyl-prolyl cis-trans isomerase 2|nr:FKBP-type peptidyl-prolyl cis-trans isomerase [Coriobacteriales bacterium]
MRRIERSGRPALVRYRGGAQGEAPIEDYSTGDPVELRIGTGAVPPGIDRTLYEMEIGEQRTLVIPPEDAYGYHDQQGVQVYPRAYIKGGDALEKGSIFGWTNPASGQQLPVRVLKADADYLTVDFNHPLAGKTLEYWLELIDIRST